MSEKWTFMVPMGNVVVHEDVGQEFKVDRVTFVHRDKLLPEVNKPTRRSDFFKLADTFAVVRETGARQGRAAVSAIDEGGILPARPVTAGLRQKEADAAHCSGK
jgi:hypothetical protein